MQLPEECFGRRFSMLFSDSLGAGASDFFISTLSLPNRAILWEVWFFAHDLLAPGGHGPGIMFLKLGEKLPADMTELDAMDDLLTGSHEFIGGSGSIRPPFHLTKLRLPVPAQGRNVVGRFLVAGAAALNFSAGLVFSSIPNEVPDSFGNRAMDQNDEMMRLLRLGVKFR